MTTEVQTVTIPKAEYEKLKREVKVDTELIEKIKRSLEDIKHGRIKEWHGSLK